jgi:hypothetical protein
MLAAVLLPEWNESARTRTGSSPGVCDVLATVPKQSLETPSALSQIE